MQMTDKYEIVRMRFGPEVLSFKKFPKIFDTQEQAVAAKEKLLRDLPKHPKGFPINRGSDVLQIQVVETEDGK
jgi:hypothetical protein